MDHQIFFRTSKAYRLRYSYLIGANSQFHPAVILNNINMPKPSSSFIPIAPHPGSPQPIRPHRPQGVVPSGSTTRTRGPTGRFASLAPTNDRLCALCGRTETSQWRTGSEGQRLCNACGIRCQRKPNTSSSYRKRKSVKKTPAKLSADEAIRRSATNNSMAKIASCGAGPPLTLLNLSRPSSTSDPARKRQDANRLEHILNPQ